MHQEPIWQAIRRQRTDLATFLETLSDSEWNVPSLCTGWLVRDVAAHIILESRYTNRNSLVSLFKHGLNLNKFMFVFAKEVGQKPTQELVAMLREDIDKRITPVLTKPSGVLADLVIHEQDIRLAIGREKDFDPEVLRLVLQEFDGGGFGIGEILVGLHKNLKSLKLVASDIGWSRGESELSVEGRAQDLLPALAGRPFTLIRLKGDGVKILEQRIRS